MVGMNPGPFGMAQTGVPFGDVSMVRDFLGIHGPVGKAAVRASAAAGRRVRLPPLGGERNALLGMGPRSLRDRGAVLRARLRGELVPARVHGRVGAKPTAGQAPRGRARAALRGLQRRPRTRRRRSPAVVGGRHRRLRRAACSRGARPRCDDRADPAPEPRQPGGEQRLAGSRRRTAPRARLRALVARAGSVGRCAAAPRPSSSCCSRRSSLGAQPERHEVHPHRGPAPAPVRDRPLRPRRGDLRRPHPVRRALAPGRAAPPAGPRARRRAALREPAVVRVRARRDDRVHDRARARRDPDLRGALRPRSRHRAADPALLARGGDVGRRRRARRGGCGRRRRQRSRRNPPRPRDSRDVGRVLGHGRPAHALVLAVADERGRAAGSLGRAAALRPRPDRGAGLGPRLDDLGAARLRDARDRSC